MRHCCFCHHEVHPVGGPVVRGQGRPRQAFWGQLRQDTVFETVGTCLTCPPRNGEGGLTGARGQHRRPQWDQWPKAGPREGRGGGQLTSVAQSFCRAGSRRGMGLRG